MASIPVSGFPNIPKAKYGKGKEKPHSKGQIIELFGFEDLDNALAAALHNTPKAINAALLELGLLGEKETKERTPVKYGVLRASIGHFDPTGLKPGGPEGGGNASDAVFEVQEAAPGPQRDEKGRFSKKKEYAVTWGTNVQYAPWIEWGFTFNPGRVVNIPEVGFRFVHPFSYRGAHMFELGLAAASKAVVPILSHWAKQALTAGGLEEM